MDETVTRSGPWAVVLAGGDGTRLQSLTRRISGDDRPKQFCRLLGGRSLLQQTLARLSLNVEAASTLCVVVRSHEQYYRPELRALAPWQVVEQPRNRGTAAAVASALRRIAAIGGGLDVVGFFPSDHHYASTRPLQHTVAEAYRAAAAHPDRLFLVGARATCPEVDYGWIEAGAPLDDDAPDRPSSGARRIERFWEKPPERVARDLLERGCLWNTFILVGAMGAFGQLLDRVQPAFWSRFRGPARRVPDREDETVREIFADIDAVDFSREVLQRAPDALAVVPLADSGWTDLGRPARALKVMRCGPGLRVAPLRAAR